MEDIEFIEVKKTKKTFLVVVIILEVLLNGMAVFLLVYHWFN